VESAETILPADREIYFCKNITQQYS